MEKRVIMYLFQINDPRQSASLVAKIFNFVVDILEKAASALGLTYNEINIILYYFVIPLSWTLLLDRFLGKPITTLILIGAWAVLLVCKGREFRNWCDWAFDRSVDFLKWFNHLGGNYELNSVVICVIIPIVIYAGLIILQRFR